MRGIIINFKFDKGLISGEDDKRYEFSRQDWVSSQEPYSGMKVDFLSEGNSAKTIFLLSGDQKYSKIVLAIVCWFLGILGVHRFMVGKTATGVLMLVLTCTIFGIFISSIWTLVDFIFIVSGNFTDKNNIKITRDGF